MSERKPLDAALRRFIDEQAAAAGAPVPMSDEERKQMVRARMVRAIESRPSIPGLPNGVKTSDVAISSDLTARLYQPPGMSAPLPVVVYLHGGGWVGGSVASHDPFCRLLSEAANVIVVSVEYRLAPEHRYPAQVEDTLAAFHWAAQHAAEWGGDTGRLALGGDSAGGNLAAVAANRLCAKTSEPALRALLLLYPVIDRPGAGYSYTQNATGYALEAEAMHWFWNQYAPGASSEDPEVYPLQVKKVPALPPTLVTTAEYDVLRDDGIAYASKLREAGIAVTHLHSPDMHHNFPVGPSTVARFPQCNAALTEIAAWLRKTLR